MKKIFVIVRLVISTSLYLQAGMTPEQVAAHFMSGEFERGWRIKEYTPAQVEACVDRLVVAVSQPEYIERVKPIINGIHEARIMGLETTYEWSKLLPLKHLALEDIAMMHHFFYSLKQMMSLKKREYHLTTELRACAVNNMQSSTIVKLLDQVRKDIETVSQGTIMGELTLVAGYHAVGMFPPEVLEYLNVSFAQLNLKWIPLMFVMPELDNEGIFDKEFDKKSNKEEIIVRMVLIFFMKSMIRDINVSVAVSPEEYQNYQVECMAISTILDDMLAIIDDYRNQHQAA